MRHIIDPTDFLTPWNKAKGSTEKRKIKVHNAGKDEPEEVFLEPEPYTADDTLLQHVQLAIALGRPLLLQGEPGCGKTRLAYAIAYALEIPIEPIFIKSTTQAKDLLYTIDQVTRLYDAQRSQMEGNNKRTPDNLDSYVQYGAIGRTIIRAVENQQRTVILLDEIDKADLDFPNDLLHEIDRLEFSVVEVERKYKIDQVEYPQHRPIIIITHNNERRLPAPFLRRCVYHSLQFPEKTERIKEILTTQNVPPSPLTDRAVAVFQEIRELDLRKKPGMSELLDWVIYLGYTKATPEQLDQLPFIGLLLKNQDDIEKAQEAHRAKSVTGERAGTENA